MRLSETPPSAVSDEAKKRYRIAIRRAFSIFGSDPSRYYPNDFGCELLANASILIKGECNTGDGGVMWAGELRIGNKRIGVENRGDGGCNIYRPVLDRDASDNERTAVWRIEEEFTKLVHRGFDELQDTEALDDFCSVLEAVAPPPGGHRRTQADWPSYRLEADQGPATGIEI